MEIPAFVKEVQEIMVKKQKIRITYNELVRVITESGRDFFSQKQSEDVFASGVSTLIKDIHKLSELQNQLEELDLLLIATLESNLCDCDVAFSTSQFTDHSGDVHPSKDCVFVPRYTGGSTIEITPGDLIYFRTLKKLIPIAHIDPRKKT